MANLIFLTFVICVGCPVLILTAPAVDMETEMPIPAFADDILEEPTKIVPSAQMPSATSLEQLTENSAIQPPTPLSSSSAAVESNTVPTPIATSISSPLVTPETLSTSSQSTPASEGTAQLCKLETERCLLNSIFILF